jgi:hypothetical protein
MKLVADLRKLRHSVPELGSAEAILLVFNHLSGASTFSFLLVFDKSEGPGWPSVAPDGELRLVCRPSNQAHFENSGWRTAVSGPPRKLDPLGFPRDR